MTLRASVPIVGFLILGVLISRRPYLYRSLLRMLVAGGVAVSLIALSRLVFGAHFLFYGNVNDILDINDGGRALDAGGALMVGTSLLVAIQLYVHTKIPSKKMALMSISLFLFVILIATHQATAMAASLVGLAVLLVLVPGRDRALRSPILLFGLPIFAAGFWALPYIIDLPSFLVGDISQRAGNLEMRRTVWGAFTDAYVTWPFVDQAVGLAAGTPLNLMVHVNHHYHEWKAGMHSQYYGMLLSSGFLGLVSYCFALVALAYRGVRQSLKSIDGEISPALGLAICSSIAVFGYGYDVRAPEQGALLALAYVGIRNAGRRLVAFIRREPEMQLHARRYRDSTL